MDVRVQARELRNGDILRVGDRRILVHHITREAGMVAVHGYRGDGSAAPIAFHYRPTDQARVQLRGAAVGAVIEMRPDWNYYYNATPGWAPAGAAGLPVGAMVTVTPDGAGVEWTGVITSHMHDRATGEYLLRSVVLCVHRVRGIPREMQDQPFMVEITDMRRSG